MTLLVLAGTSEARELLAALSDRNDVIASLAGATRAPIDLRVPTNIGGFGGMSGFAKYLTDHGVRCVVDATHPFARTMTKTAAQVCQAKTIPHVILQRESWVPRINDDWHPFENTRELTKLIPEGSNVFLGTGRKTLEQFECLHGRNLLARVIDPPVGDFPFNNGRYLVGKPPFSVSDEVDLFQREQIDWLVVKNSGGLASRSKLDAAAQLRLPVAMLRRPALPEAIVVETVPACLNWLNEQGL